MLTVPHLDPDGAFHVERLQQMIGCAHGVDTKGFMAAFAATSSRLIVYSACAM